MAARKPPSRMRSVIHLSAGEGMVMILRDGCASILQVELGRTRGELREIKSGLKPGDQVVLNPRGSGSW